MAKPFYPHVKPGSYMANPRKGYIPYVGRGGYTKQSQMWNPEPDPIWESVTGNPVSFTAKAAPLRQLEVAFSPVQAGSGDPSPDNIRPISGWTGVTVHRTGTNLNTIPNPMTQITCYDSGGGEITRWGYEIHLPAGTYTMKPTGFQENGKTYPYQRLCVVDANGFVSYTSFSAAAGASYNQRTITLEDGQWMINYHGSSTGSGYQVRSAHLVIVQGTKDITEDIPYEGDEYTITLGQTVYSGTLDVLTGVLTVDWKTITMTGASGTTNIRDGKTFDSKGAASEFDTFYTQLYADRNVDLITIADTLPKEVLCSQAVANRYNFNEIVDLTNEGKVVFTWTNPSGGAARIQTRLAFPKSMGINTVAKANQFLADQYAAGTPVVYTVKFAIPQTIQLTPQEVESLLGENNMWSDANGNLTVTYAADPATTPIVGKGKVGQAIIGG